MDGQVPTVKHRELYQFPMINHHGKNIYGTSLAVQCLRLHISIWGDARSITGQGTNPTGHTLNKRMYTHIQCIYTNVYVYLNHFAIKQKLTKRL